MVALKKANKRRKTLIRTQAPFGVLPIVPLVILDMVPLGAIGTTNCTIGITIGTIGRALNDIGIPLAPLIETLNARTITACVQGLTIGTNGRPISFKVLPMVLKVIPFLPLVTTVGCQQCRQSTVWAKLPLCQSHMIQHGVLNFHK